MRRLFLASILIASTASLVSAQQPTGPGDKLKWDPNVEPDVSEYQLFSATTSGAQDLSGVPAATITHPTSEWTIDTEGTHFVVVTAVDRFGNSSGPSNEVNFEFNSSPPGAPTNLRIVFSDGTVVEIVRDQEGNVLKAIIIPAEPQ